MLFPLACANPVEFSDYDGPVIGNASEKRAINYEDIDETWSPVMT